MFIQRLTPIAEILQASQLSRNALNLILLPAFPVAAIVSYLRKKKEIGGWLLFSYYWMCAILVICLNIAAPKTITESIASNLG